MSADGTVAQPQPQPQPQPESESKPTQTTAAAAPACTPLNGFRSTSTRSSGRKVTFAFERQQSRPVTVDVFQQSVGRRVIGERLVARYAGRSSGFRWNGRANRRGRKVTDGYYFVRYRMKIDGRRVDVRRTALRRVGGRFSTRPRFYRRDTCGILRTYKLTRPVFGGRTNREVGIAYRLNRPGTVGVVVTRDSRVVKRFAAIRREAGQTYRLRLDSEKLGRGDYRVKLTVRSGKARESSTLSSRRL